MPWLIMDERHPAPLAASQDGVRQGAAAGAAQAGAAAVGGAAQARAGQALWGGGLGRRRVEGRIRADAGACYTLYGWAIGLGAMLRKRRSVVKSVEIVPTSRVMALGSPQRLPLALLHPRPKRRHATQGSCMGSSGDPAATLGSCPRV